MFFPVKDLALALELVFGLFWGDWFLHGWRRDCCKTDFEALFVKCSVARLDRDCEKENGLIFQERIYENSCGDFGFSWSRIIKHS